MYLGFKLLLVCLILLDIILIHEILSFFGKRKIFEVNVLILMVRHKITIDGDKKSMKKAKNSSARIHVHVWMLIACPQLCPAIGGPC